MTTPKAHYKQALKSLDRAVERGHVSERDAGLIRELASAYDENDVSVPTPPNDSPRSPETLRSYVNNLRRTAKIMDAELAVATVEDINEYVNWMLDEGKSNNTVRNYQNNIRRFYHYHDDLNVDAEEIQLVSQKDPEVDDRDILTEDEITALRDAADHPRDLCIFDLLLYTGQRNTALRALRIKDIDLDEGIYYLNTDADGLKGADLVRRKGPLLGAEGAVREWLKYHPYSDNPDAYLLTPKPRYTNVDPHEMVSRETLAYTMQQLTEGAIEKLKDDDTDTVPLEGKPTHPHAIRHNFVTKAKREYGLDDMHIKKLIGHKDGSNVMETTYAHLSDQDVVDAAKEGAGIKEPEEESSMTPNVCHCGEPLPDTAKACPRCGAVYTPDAQAAEEKLQRDADKKREETEDIDLLKAVDKIKRIQEENPELLEEIDL